MKTVFTLKDLIKYFIFICIIYSLLVLIPQNKLNTQDLIMILTVISLIFILLDRIYNIENFENMNNMFSSQDNKPNTSKNVEPVITAQPPVSNNNEIEDIRKKIGLSDNISVSPCSVEVEQLKKKVEARVKSLEDEITNLKASNNNDKYMKLLLSELVNMNVINNTDVENINNKIKMNISTYSEMIKNLENLKATSKKYRNKEFDYNELPDSMGKPLGDRELSKWDNSYALLNTNKWAVPMPRPPVCVNTTPCKVCPSTEPTFQNLQEWDESRKISNTNINKDWAKNQVDLRE